MIHAEHTEAPGGSLAPTIIGEVWQAFSSLSDAQELLAGTGAHGTAANERINHAKRHLQGFLEWVEQNHPDAFVRAVSTLNCTLEEAQLHEEHKGPET
jgi:hypothetical protein